MIVIEGIVKLPTPLVGAGILLLVLAAVPMASASTGLSGTATSCSQPYSCYFVVNGTAGSGFASTSYNGLIFRLPGETNLSHGAYTYTVVNQTGTVEHVQGAIIATDANTGKIVFGSTDTYINVTTHCSHTGCGHTYKLVSGAIKFQISNYDATNTVVSCSPSTFSAGGSTHCTAKVSDLANSSVVPTGNVTFSTYFGAGVIGTFSHHGTCTLVSGNCTVRFTAADETTGNFQVIGTYHGTHTFYKGVGSAYISVTGN
jgi:hypothetical protein